MSEEPPRLPQVPPVGPLPQTGTGATSGIYIPQPADLAASAKAGHEVAGVNTGGVGWFIVWFIGVGLAIHVLIWLVLAGIASHVVHHEAEASPIGDLRPDNLDQPLQPSPGHPTLPWQDITAMKAAQNKILDSYARIPGDSTHARIPIDRAMRLLLDTGALKLPPKAADTQPYINSTQPAPTENRS